jgi:hypothetical protein
MSPDWHAGLLVFSLALAGLRTRMISLWQFLGMVDFWLPFGLKREVLGACIDLAIFELFVRPLVI